MTNTTPTALRRSPRRHTPPDGNSPENGPNQRTASDSALAAASHVQRRLTITQDDGSANDLEMIDITNDDMARAYTFLSRQNRTTLRSIGRKWNLRGTGNKKEFLFRNLLFLYEKRGLGKDIQVLLEENAGCPSFEDFVTLAKEKQLSFEPCPTEDAIREHLRRFGDPEDRPIHSSSRASGTNAIETENHLRPSFSISEFARLLILLRDNQVCRESLLKLTQDLKRSDFEAGRTRETFWKEIEKRFNDESLKPRESFEGSVPEADPSAQPLCHRAFDVLKMHLQNARKAFTIVYANYSQSGQNDPDKWPEFLSRDREGELIASSKRSYIIFLTCRLHQQYGQDMFLLNSTLKTFHGGADEGPEDLTSTESSGSRRKRTSSDAFNETMERRWTGISKFMENTNKIGNAIQESVSSKQKTFVSDFTEFAERKKVLDMLKSAYKSYTDAKEMNADPRLVGYLKANYELAMQKFQETSEISPMEQE